MIISEMTKRRIFNLADDKGNEILFGDVSDTENNLILDKEGFLMRIVIWQNWSKLTENLKGLGCQVFIDNFFNSSLLQGCF